MTDLRNYEGIGGGQLAPSGPTSAPLEPETQTPSVPAFTTGARLAFSAPLNRGVAAPAGVTLLNRAAGSTFTTTIAGITIDNATGAVTGTPTTRSGLVVERLSNGTTRNNLLFAPDTGPRTMQPGMNLGSPSPANPNVSFLDYMKVAQPDVLPATVDANGVPQTLHPDPGNPSVGKASYIFPIDDGRTTPVKLCLLTDGDIDARIDFGPGADFVIDASGRRVATWPFGGAAQGNLVRLVISRINPNQKPTRIQLVPLSDLALFNDNTTMGYKQSWIDYLKQFHRLRSMDWFTTNQEVRIDPGASAMTYYTLIDGRYRFSCPLERFVDLCLVAGVRMWCNLHVTITDAQWQAMFPQLRRLTAIGKPPIVEHSNEIWNGGFWQSGYAAAHFDTLGVTIDNGNAKGQYWAGYRAAQLAKLSRGEGFLHAIGTQPGYEYAAPYIDQGLAKAGGSWTDFKFWTTTFYADGDWARQVGTITAERRAVQDAIVAAQDFDAAFDITCNYEGPASTSIAVIKRHMAESKGNADLRGLKLVGYEGNATSYVSNEDPNFSTRDPFYTAMTNHPLAAPVTRAVLDAADEVGMIEAVFFASDGIPFNSQYGDYAALGRPSLDGILAFAARQSAASTPDPAPAAPSVTPLPAGVAAMWDAASLAGLGNGAAVTNWTDGVGGSVASSTGGTPHTYVASSGGLPAVRLSGADVLATSGANAANGAMTGNEKTVIVVVRNIQTGASNPCLTAVGSNTDLLLQATPTQTGKFTPGNDLMYPCADAGMRTLGHSHSTARGFYMMSVNGTAIGDSPVSGGQIYIGGWQNAGTQCCGRADVLAVIVWNRALTTAEFKSVHRRYCEMLGQARPGGGTARNVSFIGDSLTNGSSVTKTSNYPFHMALGLGLPWGTWDALGVNGYTWGAIRGATLPSLGNVSAATGTRSIVCMFEWANEAQFGDPAVASTTSAARAGINAILANDSGCEVIFGTSTDRGDSFGQAHYADRNAYNAYWDNAANRTGIAAYVPLHLDPNIGVQGAAPTNGTANAYYQADDLHLTAAGYALIDNGPKGFRAAVQARLVA